MKNKSDKAEEYVCIFISKTNPKDITYTITQDGKCFGDIDYTWTKVSYTFLAH